MKDIHIRRAHEQDAEGIATMLANLAAELGDADRFCSNAEIIRRYGFGSAPLFHCLVAETGTENLGVAVYFPVFSTTRGKPGVYVQDLCVSEKARGQGLGRKLLAQVALQSTLQWRAAYMALTVYIVSQDAAQFYRRLDFILDDRGQQWALDGAAFKQLNNDDHSISRNPASP